LNNARRNAMEKKICSVVGMGRRVVAEMSEPGSEKEKKKLHGSSS